jgi:hypothetical protein
MATAKMLQNSRAWQRFLTIPDQIAADVGKQLAKEVDDMVAAMKRAAPVSDDLEKHPGQFRDSIHSYANPDRPLSYRIIADAQDEYGAFIGPHIEHGHMSKLADGSEKHVPAKPSFFPTYRARKKRMRSRLTAAGTKAIKKFKQDNEG